jgi:hypothetical protein
MYLHRTKECKKNQSITNKTKPKHNTHKRKEMDIKTKTKALKNVFYALGVYGFNAHTYAHTHAKK